MFRSSLGLAPADSAGGIPKGGGVMRFSAFAVLGVLLAASTSAQDDTAFVNFETAPVHPLDLVPSGNRLLLAHLPSATLEVFGISGAEPVAQRSIPVGLD